MPRLPGHRCCRYPRGALRGRAGRRDCFPLTHGAWSETSCPGLSQEQGAGQGGRQLLLAANIYFENTSLEEESVKPLETVYCSSTARGVHAAPGSSSPGDSAQCLLQGVEGEAAGDLLPAICSQLSCREVSVRPLFGTHRGREQPEPLQHCPNAAPAGQGAQREQLSTPASRHSISTASPGGGLLVPPLLPRSS